MRPPSEDELRSAALIDAFDPSEQLDAARILLEKQGAKAATPADDGGPSGSWVHYRPSGNHAFQNSAGFCIRRPVRIMPMRFFTGMSGHRMRATNVMKSTMPKVAQARIELCACVV
jgi:hypothetical protein